MEVQLNPTMKPLSARELEQIGENLFREIYFSYGRRLSKELRARLRHLPRPIRKKLVDKEYSGCTVLFIACLKGNLDNVKFLITVCDADIEQKGVLLSWYSEESMADEVHRVSLLFCAMRHGNVHIVKYLIRRGCDVNSVFYDGSTLLGAACAMTDLDQVQFLIENGADIHQKLSNGATCLMKSVRSTALCEYLISKGADVNARDMDGETVLHHVVRSGSFATIQLLLDHGVDPFVRNRWGDDALQEACSQGLLDNVDYLIKSIDYSKEECANAYELLGSTLIHVQQDVQDGVHRWRQACYMRLDGASYVQKKPQIPSRPEYRNMVEFSTIAELEALDEDAIRIQGLLIQERILGIDHEETLNRLMERGAFYKTNGRFQTCIDLWLLTLQVRIQKHSIFTNTISNTTRAIVKLMLILLVRNEPSMPQFKDVYAVFQRLSSTIIDIQQPPRIEPAHRAHKLNYDCTLLCLTHLMHLLLSVARSNDEHNLIKSSVSHLVRYNIRSTLSNKTLLHLSVSSKNVITSEYFEGDIIQDRIFPNSNVTKLLLECGADANAFDRSRSTPLHLASQSSNYQRELVHILVEHGAHLDLPNFACERPSTLLLANPANDIPVNNHISLQCLCANVIKSSHILSWSRIPRSIEKFIRAHHIPSKWYK